MFNDGESNGKEMHMKWKLSLCHIGFIGLAGARSMRVEFGDPFCYSSRKNI